MDLEKLLKEAREQTANMDRMERESGFAAISDLISTDPVAVMRTAIEALKAGIATDSWSCIAEGTVMLQDLERHIRAMTTSGRRG